MRDDLTIVGGGIGGLTAAVAAAEAGWGVRLHEAHTELGGRARTTTAPFVANWGPHVVYGDGPLWRWLRERALATGTHGAPRSARLVLRIDGVGRRLPPPGLVRALLRLRRAEAPVDRSFRDWAGPLVGDAHGERVAAFMGVATFDHDPGRLSAAFVQERLVRATTFPPTVRYFPSGWATIIARLAAAGTRPRREHRDRCARRRAAPRPHDPRRTDAGREHAARSSAGWRMGEHDHRVARCRVASAPQRSVRAVRPRRARLLRDVLASGSVARPGGHAPRADAGRDAPGRDARRRSAADRDAARRGLPRAGAVRETWRRRARVRGESGALDLPGRTWRDRPSVHQGDDVAIVNDCVAAPGLLSEVSHAAALRAVAGLGAAGRSRATRVARLA